jgi:hypothetical protein
MSMSAASQEALPMATGVTYLAFMTSFPPDVVLGSFTGSIIFLLGSANRPKWQWMLYFWLAFMAGLLGAAPVSDITSGILAVLSIKATIPGGMGALASAACMINVVSWLRDNPTFLLRRRGTIGGEGS